LDLEWNFCHSAQAILFLFPTHTCVLAWRVPPCWMARPLLSWAHACGGLGASEVELEGWQENSKRSTPPHVAHTTLPQLAQQCIPDIGLACGRRLSQEKEWLSCWCWLTPRRYKCWRRAWWWQVTGWPVVPSSWGRRGGRCSNGEHFLTRRGAALHWRGLHNTDGGLHYTDGGLHYTDGGLHYTLVDMCFASVFFASVSRCPWWEWCCILSQKFRCSGLPNISCISFSWKTFGGNFPK
jgi:hypothetical protein